MKICFRKEIIHSNKKNQDFYVIRLVLMNGDSILSYSQPLLWLTKEDYDNLNL